MDSACNNLVKGGNIWKAEVVFLVYDTFQKLVLLFKERICSFWEQILSFKSNPQSEKK